MRLPHWMRSARVLIGLSIIVVVALAAVFAFNLLGDGLRRTLDVRLTAVRT